jgi:trigger factor
MKTTLTDAGPYERTLTVRLGSDELSGAKAAAARRLSADLKIKGFRPGKAPASLVEAAVGKERLQSEALEETLPEIVGNALSEADLVPATVPSVAATRDTEDGVEVDVTVTLWPKLEEVPSYVDRRVEISSIEVTDVELSHEVDHLRNRFADLEDVARPADEGDYTLLDLSASYNGMPVEEVAANDLLYEIGSASLIPGMDEALAGASTGDIRKFPSVLPAGFGDRGGQQVEAQTLIKGVRAKRLPEVTDEWVSEVSEFETVGEFEDSLRAEIEQLKMSAARAELGQKLLEELSVEADIELPDALVGAEMEDLLHSLLRRLEAQGIGLETYLSYTGQEQQAFIDELRSQAARNLQARILLEAVGESEALEVDAEEVDEAIRRLAETTEQSTEELREALVQSGQVQGLVGDMLRQKALERLVERAIPVDADGTPVALIAPDETDGESGDDSAEVTE